jgi:ABC-type nitrate/sulfonate/bicarbonate transport system substrate-binding protein
MLTFASRMLTPLLLSIQIFAAAAPAVAQDTRKLDVIVFPGGFNWPIFVAQDKGLFASQGLEVNVTPTPNSKFQMTGLIDGKFQIAMTAMDNVVAYVEGQGAAPTTAAPDVLAFMGSDNGFLSVMATPDVKSFAELKGRKVAVDALSTGYAFVLRKMLEEGGLAATDVEFVQAGGVKSRYEALMKKEFAATILVSPFEAAAAREGFTNLGAASRSLGAYQGVVGAVRRDWAGANSETLTRYIRAYRSALQWLYDPNNKDEAIAILKRNVPSMADQVVLVSYRILLDPNTGFSKDAALDLNGVETVLQLRRRYGEPKKPLSDPAKYYDLRYYEAAGRKP